MTPLVDDVARQLPEPQWQPHPENQQCTDHYKSDTDAENYFPEVAERVGEIHRGFHLKSIEAGNGGVCSRETAALRASIFSEVVGRCRLSLKDLDFGLFPSVDCLALLLRLLQTCFYFGVELIDFF